MDEDGLDDRSDDDLLADLAEALDALDGRERVVAALGRGAYAWRTVDDDLLLASMSYDSRSGPVAQLRSGRGEPRTVVFSSAPLSVAVELVGTRLSGQLMPPSEGTVVVESAGGTQLSVEADELGYFFFAEPLPEGLYRIRCETDVARLVTDWLRL